jgi:excisionase family DNA binding protein
VTIDQAAAQLGKSPKTIRRMVRDGRISACLVTSGEHGPWWDVSDADVLRLANPGHAVVLMDPEQMSRLDSLDTRVDMVLTQLGELQAENRRLADAVEALVHQPPWWARVVRRRA